MPTQGPQLFGRQLSCVIGTASASWNDAKKNGLSVDGFDIKARIQRNLIGAHPNQAEVQVYNLSEHTRQLLSGGSDTVVPVKVTAGYRGGATSTVFLGTARYVWSDRERADNILKFRSGDLESAMLARGTAPTAPKMPIADALTALASAMGAGKGNIGQALANLGGVALQTVRSGSLFGSAPDRMQYMCDSLGLEWSIQNGNVQMMPKGKPVSATVYDINSDSGMVGSPNVDSKGMLKFQTLLLPGMAPGNLVRMNSRYTQGVYRIERCTWDLDTFGNEWYQTCEAVKAQGFT